MTILILETNLMWSARLAQSARALGHETVVSSVIPDGLAPDVAIVNLSGDEPTLRAQIAQLQAQGCWVVGHAGHKEKPLLTLGNDLGCDRVATNSELTHKFAQIVADGARNKA